MLHPRRRWLYYFPLGKVEQVLPDTLYLTHTEQEAETNRFGLLCNGI